MYFCTVRQATQLVCRGKLLHAFRRHDFQDIVCQSYEDRSKLLYIIEENLADERRNSIDRTLSDGVYGYQRHVLTVQIKMY